MSDFTIGGRYWTASFGTHDAEVQYKEWECMRDDDGRVRFLPVDGDRVAPMWQGLHEWAFNTARMPRATKKETFEAMLKAKRTWLARAKGGYEAAELQVKRLEGM